MTYMEALVKCYTVSKARETLLDAMTFVALAGCLLMDLSWWSYLVPVLVFVEATDAHRTAAGAATLIAREGARLIVEVKS